MAAINHEHETPKTTTMPCRKTRADLLAAPPFSASVRRKKKKKKKRKEQKTRVTA